MSTGDPICENCGNYKLQCICGQILMNLNGIKDKAARISDQMFGKGNPATAPMLKLVEEVAEVLDCINKGEDPRVEFADCFLLLLDAYRKYYGDDVDMQTLIDVSSEKLDIVAKRKWGKPNEHGVYKHIPDEENTHERPHKKQNPQTL